MDSSFDAAAQYLSKASTTSDVPTAVKLELYSLFKYVNVSPLPDTPRPSIFDFTGRAKWDAWNTAGKTYSDKAQAQSRYLQIARNLGWTEGLVPETAAAGETEDIWDSDDSDEAPSPSSRSRGGGAGFGTSVSSMAPPEDNGDTSIHGLAVSNNLTGLISFLREDPSANLNARDPFGYTPLHLAADRGNLSIVEFLLVNGADRSIKDEDEMLAVELAQAAGHEKIVQLLNSPP
ncbi:ankyrin repeat-containing domain protein [Mycena rebaudengoi]|nr:ankyrin repeat-containing domain protein [Mycena rebaudengoi]